MNSNTSKPLKVGICGLGTVGFGTLQLLKTNAEEITRRTGCEIHVVHVATRTLDQKKVAWVPASGTDPFALVNDPDVDVVIETMGGLEPAFSVIKKALAKGKHVITANRALIAEHGNELLATARANTVNITFESAVAGCIPTIKARR